MCPMALVTAATALKVMWAVLTYKEGAETSMSVNLQTSLCILAKVIVETPMGATPVHAHQDSGVMIQRAYPAFELTPREL